MIIFFYLLGVFFEISILLFFCLYLFTVIYSVLRGSFYVGTNQKQIEMFLSEANLKKGEYMLDLGSGDGRVLRTAARKYGVIGKGIDINPVLNFIANFYAKNQHLLEIKFIKDNVLTTNFSKADVIYIFLMPKLTEKFQNRLAKEAKKGSLIISHGFKVDSLSKYHQKIIEHKPFSTYFYKIS
jgi:SAM-dependent methyltransferase